MSSVKTILKDKLFGAKIANIQRNSRGLRPFLFLGYVRHITWSLRTILGVFISFDIYLVFIEYKWFHLLIKLSDCNFFFSWVCKLTSAIHASFNGFVLHMRHFVHYKPRRVIVKVSHQRTEVITALDITKRYDIKWL